jgi:hypothetical protein
MKVSQKQKWSLVSVVATAAVLVGFAAFAQTETAPPPPSTTEATRDMTNCSTCGGNQTESARVPANMGVGNKTSGIQDAQSHPPDTATGADHAAPAGP